MTELKIGSIGVDMDSDDTLCEIVKIVDNVIVYKQLRKPLFFMCKISDFWVLM